MISWLTDRYQQVIDIARSLLQTGKLKLFYIGINSNVGWCHPFPRREDGRVGIGFPVEIEETEA